MHGTLKNWPGILLLAAMLLQPAAASGRQDAAGIVPVAIRIPKALIATTVEPLGIDGGSPESPSGTWVVGWYEGYGPLGDGDNAVFYGYPDFLGIGPAVFWFLPLLRDGDAVEMLGDDGLIHPYAVSSVTLHDRASPPLDDIFGDTDGEMLTLFTAAPPYDEQGDYAGLVVVRAAPAGEPFALAVSAAVPEIDEAACTSDPRSSEFDGSQPFPVDAGPAARDDIDLASAAPAHPQAVAAIEAILQGATECPIAVREALALSDGRVVALVGPPGLVPLDALTSVDGYASLSAAREAKAMVFVVFVPEGEGWAVEGIPWFAGNP